MAKQQTSAGLAWKNKRKKTRRERFLNEMNQIIPWKELMGLIEPHYPKAGRRRQPLGLEKMLRIYLFDAAGNVIQTYNPPVVGTRWSGLAITADAASFWSAKEPIPDTTLYRIDLASGAILETVSRSFRRTIMRRRSRWSADTGPLWSWIPSR